MPLRPNRRRQGGSAPGHSTGAKDTDPAGKIKWIIQYKRLLIVMTETIFGSPTPEFESRCAKRDGIYNLDALDIVSEVKLGWGFGVTTEAGGPNSGKRRPLLDLRFRRQDGKMGSI